MSSLAQLFFDDSSSDDDDYLEMVTALYADFVSSKRPKHGGSVPGHALVHRRKQAGHDRLMADYFVDEPIFGPATFRRRFRMSRDLFLRIANAVEAHCPYFVQRRNASGQLGHSALKKIAAAVRMRGQPEDFNYDTEFTYAPPVQPEKDNDRINKFLKMHRKIENREGHNQLRDDLIEHLWQLHGQ